MAESQLLDDCLRFIAKCVADGFDNGNETDELRAAKQLLARVPAEVGYQGWSNRETWSAYVHLTNDVATYEAARSLSAAELREFTNRLPVETRLEIGSEWRVNWHQLVNGLAQLGDSDSDE